MSFDFKAIFICLGFALAFIFLIKVFKKPLGWVLAYLIRCILGLGLLVLINFLFLKTGFRFSLNPFNALVVGSLGLPGILVLFVFTYFF